MKALRFVCLLVAAIILTTYMMSVAVDALLYELDSRPAPSVGYPVSQHQSKLSTDASSVETFD